MLVLSIGVRPAARQLGISEDTVADWSRQGKWLADTRVRPAYLPPPATMRPSNPSMRPADALEKVLREDHNATKTNVLRFARAASAEGARIAEETPEKALDQAANMKQVAQAAAIAAGEKTGDGTQVLINIALLGRELGTE